MAIIVIEGVSASGKTSWCAAHAGPHVVAENGPATAAPDRDLEPSRAGRYWADRNAERWQKALAVEARSGIAVCDTDPLKLHYSWSLWRLGAAPEAHWLHELAATRAAFADRHIGFADAYYVRDIDPTVARRQRDGDVRRGRRNFDLHIRLQPALLDWYRKLATLLPGRVRFDWPRDLASAVPANLDRYDLALFDDFAAWLQRA